MGYHGILFAYSCSRGDQSLTGKDDPDSVPLHCQMISISSSDISISSTGTQVLHVSASLTTCQIQDQPIPAVTRREGGAHA